ncbi:hypothetical protein PCASD_16997 [Puccinia coronata f. sp. avenae]|uniref:Retrotransposon gag domain-containing protein n=1 Tax=Puccinia coronata f. sp. avenae TaxID=200324 RepID=A0A2N5T9V3_9BASI|nr:hypothetical protein PCASD_16997 [Puccinia coronata f. sp. avenae]
MLYGLPNDSITEDSPPPQGTNQANSQPVDRIEFNIMHGDINRMQRSFDRFLDIMMASQDSPKPGLNNGQNLPQGPGPHTNHQRTFSSGQQPPFSTEHHYPHPNPPNPFLRPPFSSAPHFSPAAEPLKLKDVWFSGESAHLLSFLQVTRDFLRQNNVFQSESHWVVWISRHFGYSPSEHRKTPSPVENWYNSLVIDNARRQGILDMYTDLDGQEFVIPTLQTVLAFLDGLIAVFGDKFMRDNAKRALAACKQRNLTIGEYNSQFKSLVYLVEDVEVTCIEKYVSGLNPRIIRKVMCKAWMDCTLLDAKMEMASDAAAQLDVLAQLPPKSSSAGPHQPLLSHRYIAQPPQQPRPPRDPDAMEIDAARVLPRIASARSSLLDASRALCRARQLCFRCLAPIVPGSHTGSINCPKTPATDKQREAFIARCRQGAPSASISAVSTAAPIPSPPHSDNPLTHRKSRLLVPASFKTPDGACIPATILVDTGAMANFVNEGFICRHELALRQRKTPIRCVGFNGQEAVGGIVSEDWAGTIQLSTNNAKPFALHSSFGVMRLGSVDAIFGLPWLDKQGWVASGSLKGGHQFTLGSTPLYVIESASLGGKPAGTMVFSAQISPPLPF